MLEEGCFSMKIWRGKDCEIAPHGSDIAVQHRLVVDTLGGQYQTKLAVCLGTGNLKGVLDSWLDTLR